MQSAKRRNVFSDLLVGGSYPYQFVQFVQIAQFAKAVINLSAICKTKKCLSDLHIGVPLSICVICANCTICKSRFQFECNLQNEEMSFRSTHWSPLSISVICANCRICKSRFQFECNLQNEEMYFQIYSLEDRTLINLCNLCKLHNLQKPFSI